MGKPEEALLGSVNGTLGWCHSVDSRVVHGACQGGVTPGEKGRVGTTRAALVRSHSFHTCTAKVLKEWKVLICPALSLGGWASVLHCSVMLVSVLQGVFVNTTVQ